MTDVEGYDFDPRDEADSFNIPFLERDEARQCVRYGTPCGGDSVLFHDDGESITFCTELMDVTMNVTGPVWDQMLTRAKESIENAHKYAENMRDAGM